MIVVSDTQVLIGLAKGGVFDLLPQAVAEVVISPGVWQEVVVAGHGRPGEACYQAGFRHVLALGGLDGKRAELLEHSRTVEKSSSAGVAASSAGDPVGCCATGKVTAL